MADCKPNQQQPWFTAQALRCQRSALPLTRSASVFQDSGQLPAKLAVLTISAAGTWQTFHMAYHDRSTKARVLFGYLGKRGASFASEQSARAAALAAGAGVQTLEQPCGVTARVGREQGTHAGARGAWHGEAGPCAGCQVFWPQVCAA